MFKLRLPNLMRFSLRTLFVLMTLCCILFGAWSVYVNPYRLQAQSLAAVNRLQGNSAKLPAEGPAWHRWLVTKFLGDDAFTKVTQVDLAGRQVDDAAFRALTGLKNLETISLDNTQITDASADVFRAMPALATVSLRYTNISDHTAANLAALPRLRSATLTGTKITDAAVDNLAKQTALQELFIRWTKITNEGAARLTAALPKCTINFHALVAESHP